MDKVNDGKPAFPLYLNGADYSRGMSLRDWFAGMAVQGMLASSRRMNGNPNPDQNEFAEAAYLYADAMLQQRGQRCNG